MQCTVFLTEWATLYVTVTVSVCNAWSPWVTLCDRVHVQCCGSPGPHYVTVFVCNAWFLWSTLYVTVSVCDAVGPLVHTVWDRVCVQCMGPLGHTICDSVHVQCMGPLVHTICDHVHVRCCGSSGPEFGWREGRNLCIKCRTLNNAPL